MINVALYATPSSDLIPNASTKVLHAMNIEEKDISIEKIKDDNIFDHKKNLKDLNILFTKIDYDN